MPKLDGASAAHGALGDAPRIATSFFPPYPAPNVTKPVCPFIGLSSLTQASTEPSASSPTAGQTA